MYRFGRILGGLTDLLTVVGCIAVVMMMVHITFDVAMRWIGLPIPATITIVPHYYMLPIVFLPLALTERRDAHITVEVFVQLLGRRPQQALAVLGWTVSAVVFSILFYQTLLDAIDKMRVGTFIMEVDVRIPIWGSYFFLPIGFGAVVAVLVYRILVTVADARSGLGEARHEAFRDAPEAAGSGAN
ncbi:TRAP transporter small permease [Acuticoccus sp.]|uniref:TRAP transporter small permease n=1 Tax=Acuticoccus sp. TaxID=1904378 RepID=UPI003B51B6E1